MNQLRQSLRQLLTVTPGPESTASNTTEFTAACVLPADWPLFEHHFPGHPVLPGVCLLQAVLVATAINCQIQELHLQRVVNAKFLAPVLPEQKMELRGQCTTRDDGSLAIKATVFANSQKAAIISLIAGGDGHLEVNKGGRRLMPSVRG